MGKLIVNKKLSITEQFKRLNIYIFILFFRVPISTFLGKKSCRRRRSISHPRNKRNATKQHEILVPHQHEEFVNTVSENVIKQSELSDPSINSSQSNLELSKKSIALATTTDTPSKEIEPESDYDNVYDYDYYNGVEIGNDIKDDCNDFSDLIESRSNEQSHKKVLDSLPPNVYCEVINSLDTKCLEQSLLEIWMYHEETINRLTQEDILFAINKLDKSPYFGFAYNFSDLLGSVTRNESGHVVGAKSALHHFVTVVDLENLSGVRLDDFGTAPTERLDEANYQWQWEVIKTVLRQDEEHSNEGVRIRVRMTRSYTDVSSAVVFLDLRRVVVCVIIMFIYTSLMLGHVDLIQQRIYLTIAGMTSVMLGLVIAFGITFALGFPYMPHYTVLPFMMIGLGIDDMFVIVKCWYNLDINSKKTKSLEENMALTLKNAGVAITVTSVTDICAFAVGCITIIPGLQAFCLNLAIGIAAVFLLQVSWFVAWMTLDEKRIKRGGNAILPCIIHTKLKEENESNENTNDKSSWKNMGKHLFKWYGNLLNYELYSFLVISITLCLLSFGLYGTINIKQEFDEIKQLPPDTYLREWFENIRQDFTGLGQNVKLFTGYIDPMKDLSKLDLLLEELEDMKRQKFIIKDMDSWWIEFKIFIQEKWNIQDWKLTLPVDNKSNPDSHTFDYLLSDFLHSSKGGKYKSNIIFNGTLTCNKAAPPITASSSDITYRKFNGPSEHIPNVDLIENLINSKKISAYVFTNGRVYGLWDMDRAIVRELWRNLGCAIACVLAITFLLLADVYASIQVLICVVFTLLDVVGSLHFWGITIDSVSCSCIIVIVGLCVDYSVHIVHTFLVSTGKIKF